MKKILSHVHLTERHPGILAMMTGPHGRIHES
jgi:hypothetical protein